MFGFTFGGPDPHNTVANRAIKVLLGTHLQTLMPKIRQRIVQGVARQLGEVNINSDGQYLYLGYEPKRLSKLTTAILALYRIQEPEYDLFCKSHHNASEQPDLIRR